MVVGCWPSREDIFADYTEAGFEAAFAQHFELVEEAEIPGTVRRLFRLRRLDRPDAD